MVPHCNMFLHCLLLSQKVPIVGIIKVLIIQCHCGLCHVCALVNSKHSFHSLVQRISGTLVAFGMSFPPFPPYLVTSSHHVAVARV